MPNDIRGTPRRRRGFSRKWECCRASRHDCIDRNPGAGERSVGSAGGVPPVANTQRANAVHASPSSPRLSLRRSAKVSALPPMEQTPPTKSPTGGKLGRGPRREFQSPIRGRGWIPRHQRQNAEYGPGQTCIRAKRTTACDGLCARDRNLYTIPRKCAATSCSLGVCAPTPGWDLAWNKRLTH